MISGLERILWSETFTPNNTLAERKKYYLMAISITFLAELSLFFREKLHFGWKRMMKSEESSDLQKRKGRDDSLPSLSSLPWISVLLSFCANTGLRQDECAFCSTRYFLVRFSGDRTHKKISCATQPASCVSPDTYTLKRSVYFISVHLARTCGRVGWLRCGLWIAATACWWRTW